VAGGQRPIGQILKEMELVSEDQIQEALTLQERQGGVLGQILVRLGYVANDEVLLALAVQIGMVVVDLRGMPGDVVARAARLMEEERVEFLTPSPSRPLDGLAGSAPVTKLLNLILCTALKAEATELHFHVWDDLFHVRYRIDGVLYDMESPPVHLVAPLLARIHYLTGYPEQRSATATLAGRRYRIEPVADGRSMFLKLLPIP
jgi:type II secretory ATPase GspE/PulE/Tfp pilus assembly ATPase PilB-like protein